MISNGKITCNEECDPPDGVTCDNNCKFISPCKECSTANNLGSGSISLGGHETAYTCNMGGTNIKDCLKIKTNNIGKLKVTLTPPTDSDYDLLVCSDCSGCSERGPSKICSSIKGKNLIDSCPVDPTVAGQTYYIQASQSTGSGIGTVEAVLGECFENDLKCGIVDLSCPEGITLINDPDNDRSSDCIAKDPAKPRCELVGTPLYPKYTCRPPEPCNTNADCPSKQCCTKEIGIQPYECVPTTTKPSIVYNPYLCVRT